MSDGRENKYGKRVKECGRVGKINVEGKYVTRNWWKGGKR